MRTGTKLGAFALGIAAIFVAAMFVGRAAGPIDVGGADGAGHAAMDTASGDVSGLAIAEGGFRLELDNDVVPADESSPFAFRIIDGSGAPFDAFEEFQKGELDLIVVSHNLVDFWHLHPTVDRHGIWAIELPAMAPGSYRVFVDVQPVSGEPQTLGADIVVAGSEAPSGADPGGH